MAGACPPSRIIRWNLRLYFALPAIMTEEAEARYFASRELRERALSRRARDQRAAEAHAEMAERYSALAVVFGAQRPLAFPNDL